MTLQRTKAYLYPTNELGPLLQLAVATGSIKCENERIFSKIILSGERHPISSDHTHYNKAQLLLYFVQWWESPKYLCSSW